MEDYSLYKTIKGNVWILVGDIYNEDEYTLDDLEAIEELLSEV